MTNNQTIKSKGYVVKAAKEKLIPYEFERRALRPKDVEIGRAHV